MNIPSITSLHDEKNTKEKSKLNIFKIVLTKCIEKIVYTNRHTEQTFVIFEVPKILIGYPSYDMKSCIIYLMNQLSRHNYMVDFIHPFYLYIDWGSNHKTSINQKMISQQIISDKLKSKLPLLNTNNEKLTKQTQQLLDKFPGTSEVEFVYEDEKKSKKGKAKKPKKK